MREIRKVCVVVEKECEVEYYVNVETLVDAHFAPKPDYVLENKYFNTKKEAIDFMNENVEKFPWDILSIKEKVTPIN